jgi:hypothetical protein
MNLCAKLDHTLRRALLIALLVLTALTAAGATQAAPTARESSVVLLMATSPQSTRERARLEALRIHLTDVASRVEIEASSGSLTTTHERVNAAVALGRRHHAAAVLFVEELGETELRLYWVEPKRGRAWMRQLSFDRDGVAAADETAALVARGGVEELLEAGQMSMKPVATVPIAVTPPPAAGDTSKPPVAKTSRLRAGAMYQGTSFAPEATWQHGLQVLLAARLAQTFYLAAKHTFTEPITVTKGSVTAHLVRRPTELAFGYQADAPVALRSELGVFADHVARTTTHVQTDQLPTRDAARVFLGASLRLGVEVRLGQRVRLVGSSGAEFLLNGFDYLTDDASHQVAINVRRVRPLIEAGLAGELW